MYLWLWPLARRNYLLKAKDLILLSVIMKRVSMYYFCIASTARHMVISSWEVKDLVQLSNCQRYDQEHNRGEQKELSPSFNKCTDNRMSKKKKRSKHLIVRHPFRKSSSKKCCHLPLILLIVFFLKHPLSSLPDSVCSSADSSKIQLLSRRVQEEKWAALS